MVHLAGLAALKHESNLCAQRLFHQVMMHRAGDHQGAQRHTVSGDGAVRKDGEAVAISNGLLGLGTDALQRLGRAGWPICLGKSDVDFFRAPTAVIHALERMKLPVGQNGMRQAQALAVGLGCVDQVFLGANVAFKRHDDLLANGVDGGICHLCKELTEIIVEHPRLVAEAGQRGVVAHGADRVAKLMDEWQEHELHRLGGEPEGLHALAERVRSQAVRLAGGGDVVQFDALVSQPFAVRPAGRKVGLDFLIGHHCAFLKIDEKHPARLQAAFGFYVGGIDGDYTHLAGHDHAVVVGEIIAAGAQAVAVEHRADIFAVGKGDGRRPVPRLHEAGVVLVKIPLGLGHLPVFLPCLGHHQQHRLLQRPAAHQQKLQRVVEVARVGTFRLHDRIQLLQIVAEEVALQRALTRPHGVDVAAQRVDLAVVAHEPERLRAIPARERVGGKTRMHHREVRLVIRVGEIGKVGEQLVGGEHPLVNHHLGGQATDVKQQRLLEGCVEAQLMAGAFADDVELALKVITLYTVGRADEQLHDVRLGSTRAGAHVGLVRLHRHLAPAETGLPLLCDDGLHGDDAFRALGLDPRKKNQPRAEAPLGRQLHAHLLAGDLLEEPPRQTGEDAAAVAGIRLTATGTAVIHVLEHLDRIEHILVAWLAFHVGDKTNAAAVLLVGWIVQALLLGESHWVDSVTHSVQIQKNGKNKRKKSVSLSQSIAAYPAFSVDGCVKGRAASHTEAPKAILKWLMHNIRQSYHIPLLVLNPSRLAKRSR